MRWSKAGVRTLLIFTVINCALAAPIGIQEISEVLVRDDVVDVAADGTGASQKRGDPWGKSSKNAAPSPGWSGLEDWSDEEPKPHGQSSKNAPGWSGLEDWSDEEPKPQNLGSSTVSNSGTSKLTPSKRPRPESTGDFFPEGSSDEPPSSSSTKWSSDEYSPSWPKEPTDEYSPSWSKEPTDEYSPSWSKGSTNIYSPTSWSTGDSHPPNPGLIEDHLPPAPSNPEPSAGAHQSTNDRPAPSSPEPHNPVAPEPEDFFSKLLNGKFRIPRHISGSGAVNAAQG